MRFLKNSSDRALELFEHLERDAGSLEAGITQSVAASLDSHFIHRKLAKVITHYVCASFRSPAACQ
jgi:hypothetical protein